MESGTVLKAGPVEELLSSDQQPQSSSVAEPNKALPTSLVVTVPDGRRDK
jgi:hypothetical protein